MEIERYRYLCSLIIDCAAYRIGGPDIHERIIEQNLPALQQHYPEQIWTLSRVRHLFEGDSLLNAVAINRVNITDEQDGATSGKENFHAEHIQALLARIDDIRRRLLNNKQAEDTKRSRR